MQSWYDTQLAAIIIGAILGLLLLPVTAAVHGAREKQKIRRILYDDIARSYVVVAEVVAKIATIWDANSKAILGDFFENIMSPDTADQRQTRDEIRAKLIKSNVLPVATEMLKHVQLKRYDTLTKSKLLVMYELVEYNDIEYIFELLKHMKEGTVAQEEVYNHIGWFQASFQKLHQKSLRRGLKRMVKGESLKIALEALKSDAKVII